MNSKQLKKLRKLIKPLQVEWLQSLLPDEQAKDITVNNVSAGIITATTYVGVPEGTNVLKAMLFV